MDIFYTVTLLLVSALYFVSWRKEHLNSLEWINKYSELLRKNRDLTIELENVKPKRRSKKDE